MRLIETVGNCVSFAQYRETCNNHNLSIPKTLKHNRSVHISIIDILFCLSKNFCFFVKHFGKESVILKMKKSVSISLTFLLIFALFHFYVATHYCGGTIAATRISLSGKLASCGMEKDEDNSPLPGINLVNHCCDNQIAYFGITNKYYPTFSYVPEVYRGHFKVLSIPAGINIQSALLTNSIFTNVSPPGESVSNNVDLSDICVYRI